MTSRNQPAGNRRERRAADRDARRAHGPESREDTNETRGDSGAVGDDTATPGAVGHPQAPHDEGQADRDARREADAARRAELIAYRRDNPIVSDEELAAAVHQDLLDHRREAARLRWRSSVPWRFQFAPRTDMTVVGVEKWTQDRIAEARATGRLSLLRAPSLLLVGGLGTGKTHAAWWAIGRLAQAGVITDWEVATASHIYRSLRADQVDTAERLRRYCRVPLLVMDDAGTVDTTAHTDDVDYTIINYRYEQGLPVIITTNLPPEKHPGMPDGTLTLNKRLEARAYSRLTQMLEGHAYSLGLADRRVDPELREGSGS